VASWQLKGSVRIRFTLGDEIAIGPGKAALLAAIRSAGSISAAAKQLGMSYRRAWLLVETMNNCFGQPLVAAAKGGSGGGGAMVTEAGLAVLEAFSKLQTDVDALVASHSAEFESQLKIRRPPAKS
jgi:molybdate transport system regulatory protein